MFSFCLRNKKKCRRYQGFAPTSQTFLLEIRDELQDAVLPASYGDQDGRLIQSVAAIVRHSEVKDLVLHDELFVEHLGLLTAGQGDDHTGVCGGGSG